MTHVVTDNCKACRFTEFVVTSLVDCFHVGDNMLYIDPVECIDCTPRIPACPVQAIYSEHDMPDDKQHWVAVNAEQPCSLPVIHATLDPLSTVLNRQRKLGFE